MNFVYDAAVLVAADRNDRTVWTDHEARLLQAITPIVPAPVIAQVSRSPRQARLRQFLRGCESVEFSADAGHEVGGLLGATGQSDVVDAHVVVLAGQRGATVITADIDDLRPLAEAMPVSVVIQPL